ncbi:hypothetical protein H0A70_05335 [Alcaligenaceae bacterium]|nr:hypothetical protein [Alcaligenaceae bacterium]
MTAITVRFEDRGQDFLEFDIENGKIIAARPFQHDIWAGREVVSTGIAAGDYLVIRTAAGQRTIIHPVAEVRPLGEPLQIGPTDI